METPQGPDVKVEDELLIDGCNEAFAEGGEEEEEEDPMHSTDEFRMYCFKVLPCDKRQPHDWLTCPYTHPGEKARRRDPRLHQALTCPGTKRSGKCSRGPSCPYAHGVFELWLHPSRYRTQMCTDGTSCTRKVCFFAHTPEQLRQPTPTIELASSAVASSGATASASDANSSTGCESAAESADSVNLQLQQQDQVKGVAAGQQLQEQQQASAQRCDAASSPTGSCSSSTGSPSQAQPRGSPVMRPHHQAPRQQQQQQQQQPLQQSLHLTPGLLAQALGIEQQQQQQAMASAALQQLTALQAADPLQVAAAAAWQPVPQLPQPSSSPATTQQLLAQLLAAHQGLQAPPPPQPANSQDELFSLLQLLLPTQPQLLSQLIASQPQLLAQLLGGMHTAAPVAHQPPPQDLMSLVMQAAAAPAPMRPMPPPQQQPTAASLLQLRQLSLGLASPAAAAPGLPASAALPTVGDASLHQAWQPTAAGQQLPVGSAAAGAGAYSRVPPLPHSSPLPSAQLHTPLAAAKAGPAWSDAGSSASHTSSANLGLPPQRQQQWKPPIAPFSQAASLLGTGEVCSLSQILADVSAGASSGASTISRASLGLWSGPSSEASTAFPSDAASFCSASDDEVSAGAIRPGAWLGGASAWAEPGKPQASAQQHLQHLQHASLAGSRAMAPWL